MHALLLAQRFAPPPPKAAGLAVVLVAVTFPGRPFAVTHEVRACARQCVRRGMEAREEDGGEK